MRRLSIDDAPALQELFERASDFFELCDGGPTRPTAAIEELTHVPDGASLSDLYVFGQPDSGALNAVVSLLDDRRADATWWISLMLIDPALRNSGLGTQLFDWSYGWLAEQGAQTIYIGVVVANEPAQRFWKRRGFEERTRQPYTTLSGFETEIIIMRRGIEPWT